MLIADEFRTKCTLNRTGNVDDAMNHILIVDDDPVVRYFIRRMLGIQGYTCEEAVHGGDAVERLNMALPRLIIADHDMPIMNGIELLAYMANQTPRLSIPLILMTKGDEEDMKTQARELGALAVLGKPLDYRQMSSMVASIFS